MALRLDLDWLVKSPIAHRGLHDRSLGCIENSIRAAKTAVAKGYAIECDVQLTRDGEAIVFHDDTLERLTSAQGRVNGRTAAELTNLKLCETGDAIPSLQDFLEAVGGGSPLVIELKSNFDGDLRLAQRLAEQVASYRGPVAIESFDPDPIAFLRKSGPSLGLSHVPLGIVGQARYEPDDWPGLSREQAAEMTHFLHYPRTRPDFLSWNFNDLPNATPFLCRSALNLPVTVWTVRSSAQAEFAARWADQIVFEGFAPGSPAPSG